MTETEFLALIDQVLNSIESQADDWAASLDVDVETSRSGNVLTMVFEDNTHVVVNSQAAMQELWVAAAAGSIIASTASTGMTRGRSAAAGCAVADLFGRRRRAGDDPPVAVPARHRAVRRAGFSRSRRPTRREHPSGGGRP